MLDLKVGQVFHLWCAFCVPPKWKFFVLASLDPRPRYFVINSNPAPFQRANAELLAHQVRLGHGDHAGFLKHDSVMDCSQLVGGPTASDLEDRYQRDPNVLIGTIAAASAAATAVVIRESALLTAREIEALLAGWGR